MFTSESQIIVEQGAKLTIEGAKLTTCPLSPSWKGIKVSADYPAAWGFGPPSTEVIVRGEGIIEHAEVAIDAVGQLTFLSTLNMGGAKITIENSSAISHCGIGVKLGPLYGVNDLSSFDNSFFNYNDRAIQLENNNGLKITKCTFQHNYLDIEGFTSSVYADNNTFNAPSEFSALYPQFYGSTFINNDFYSDIDPTGLALMIGAMSNSSDFSIHNNQFFGTGILTTGELDFDIQGNDFHDSPQGTWINESGDNIINDIHQNKFYDNIYGNSASGVNSAEYLKNCFENTAALSIEVNEASSIGFQQGSDQDAAGNCFYASGKVGTGQSSAFFDYYVKQGEVPQSCKKPGSGNFDEEAATQDINLSCGTGINIYGTLPYIVRNCMYGNGISLQQAITLLKAEILRIQNATNINPWTKRWLIAKYKKCLDRLIKQKAKEDKDQSGRESAVQFLLSQPEFRYQSMAYGLVLESGDITRSTTMLNNLSPSDTGETEFVQSQHILLDYLRDRSGYNAPTASLSALYNAGLRKHPLAGFSRSIYYTLTGQKVPVTLTHLNGGTKTRSNVANISKSFIMPNPSVDGTITITIPNYDNDIKYTITVHNLTGKEVYKSNLSEIENIIQTDLTNGLYIVSLHGNSQPIKTQKWVIVK